MIQKIQQPVANRLVERFLSNQQHTGFAFLQRGARFVDTRAENRIYSV